MIQHADIFSLLPCSNTTHHSALPSILPDNVHCSPQSPNRQPQGPHSTLRFPTGVGRLCGTCSGQGACSHMHMQGDTWLATFNNYTHTYRVLVLA